MIEDTMCFSGSGGANVFLEAGTVPYFQQDVSWMIVGVNSLAVGRVSKKLLFELFLCEWWSGVGFVSFLCKFVLGWHVDVDEGACDTFVDVEYVLVGSVVVVVVWSSWKKFANFFIL